MTVGTGSFDVLILKTAELFCSKPQFEVVYQVGNSKTNFNMSVNSFLDNFDDVVDTSDLVVTHAGAGTVFSLLEKKKLFIVVPNQQRADKHQLDIAHWLYENDYCEVCFNIDEFDLALSNAVTRRHSYRNYNVEKFAIASFMEEIIYA